MKILLFFVVISNIVFRIYKLVELCILKHRNGNDNYSFEFKEYFKKLLISFLLFLMFSVFLSNIQIALFLNVMVCIVLITMERNYLKKNGLRPISFNTVVFTFFFLISFFSLF